MLPAIPVVIVGAALLRWWRGHGTLGNLMVEVAEVATGVPLTPVAQALAGEKKLLLVFPKDGVWSETATPENYTVVEISEKDFGNLLLLLLTATGMKAVMSGEEAKRRGLVALQSLLNHATDSAYFTPRGGVKYAKFLLQRFGDALGDGDSLSELRRIAAHYAKEGISLIQIRDWMKEVPSPLFLRSEEGGAICSELEGNSEEAEEAALLEMLGELPLDAQEELQKNLAGLK